MSLDFNLLDWRSTGAPASGQETHCRYASSRCATSATRPSGAPANPPSTGSAGRSVPFVNRSLCYLESETTEIGSPPSVGPATCLTGGYRDTCSHVSSRLLRGRCVVAIRGDHNPSHLAIALGR